MHTIFDNPRFRCNYHNKWHDVRMQNLIFYFYFVYVDVTYDWVYNKSIKFHVLL